MLSALLFLDLVRAAVLGPLLGVAALVLDRTRRRSTLAAAGVITVVSWAGLIVLIESVDPPGRAAAPAKDRPAAAASPAVVPPPVVVVPPVLVPPPVVVPAAVVPAAAPPVTPPPITPPPAPVQALRPLARAEGLTGQAAEDAACRRDLDCWVNRHRPEAWGACSDAIERLGQYAARWTDGWAAIRFPGATWADQGAGTLRFFGGAIEFQNGFGAWQPHLYACVYDPAGGTVERAEAWPGRL